MEVGWGRGWVGWRLSGVKAGWGGGWVGWRLGGVTLNNMNWEAIYSVYMYALMTDYYYSRTWLYRYTVIQITSLILTLGIYTVICKCLFPY